MSFWLFVGYMVLNGIMSHKQSEISPQRALDIHSSIFEEGLPMISGNSLIPMSYLSDPVKMEVRASIIEETAAEKNPLIECLIKYESQGNPKAYNPKDIDNRPKYGILQFDSRTFDNFCVKTYKLPNNLWDPEIQKQCAIKMIDDGLAGHWGTLKYCKGFIK